MVSKFDFNRVEKVIQDYIFKSSYREGADLEYILKEMKEQLFNDGGTHH